jgi:hypothetical protein
VIDAAAVDGRRRLVLVRRDNVEHLLMIGGPADLVVEPNIVRARRSATRRPRAPAGTELPPSRPRCWMVGQRSSACRSVRAPRTADGGTAAAPAARTLPDDTRRPPVAPLPDRHSPDTIRTSHLSR